MWPSLLQRFSTFIRYLFVTININIDLASLLVVTV